MHPIETLTRLPTSNGRQKLELGKVIVRYITNLITRTNNYAIT